MGELAINIGFSLIAGVVVHEFGHFFVAFIIGAEPRLILAIPPRVEWLSTSDTRARLIAVAGFAAEIAAAGALLALAARGDGPVTIQTVACYLGVLTGHLAVYPFTARDKDSNDFNYLGKRRW